MAETPLTDAIVNTLNAQTGLERCAILALATLTRQQRLLLRDYLNKQKQLLQVEKNKLIAQLNRVKLQGNLTIGAVTAIVDNTLDKADAKFQTITNLLTIIPWVEIVQACTPMINLNQSLRDGVNRLNVGAYNEIKAKKDEIAYKARRFSDASTALNALNFQIDELIRNNDKIIKFIEVYDTLTVNV